MLILCFAGVTHAEMISWYNDGDGIKGLSAGIDSAPSTWTAMDEAWNTSDEVIPAVGKQAASKAALSNVSNMQYKALISLGADAMVVSGGGHSSVPAANYAIAACDVRPITRSFALNRITPKKTKVFAMCPFVTKPNTANSKKKG